MSLGIRESILIALMMAWMQSLLLSAQPQAEWLSTQFNSSGTYVPIEVRNPLDNTVFPPEMPPPVFQWTDSRSGANAWWIVLRWPEPDKPQCFSVLLPQWQPKPDEWYRIKQQSMDKFVQVVILGYSTNRPETALSRVAIRFSTSSDVVGAPLFYREVNLPFEDAVKDPSQIRWRFGPISSPEPPPVILDNLPVCGNCHSFSRDGGLMGMDVDYANSKGSYVIARTGPQMILHPRDIITWDDFRREDGEQTFGLLSQVSPDGRYVVSTVKDKSVFVPKPDLSYSQLFFPIKGILAVYNRETQTFNSLAGADDPAYVQSNPAWSPDGQYLLFARSKAYNLSNTAGQGKVLLTPDECREFLKDGKPFRFDMYRVAFNEGKGGKSDPLAGASDNGLSNFFPKYSPDGKWIVFCQSSNYMLLQPDSQLFIIPAAGGSPRRLRANTPRMNSWHSWSPNSRWLVFASKANSAFTQLFLTHIDAHGESTPPVLLAHLTAPDRAANIPEFVSLSTNSIARIQAQFLNDYSFERAGNEFYRAGDPDRAIEKYRQALALNPSNANAHQRLGFLLLNVKHQYDEGLLHTREAARLNPKHGLALCDLGVILLNQGRASEAMPLLQKALELLPFHTDLKYKPQSLRYYLGRACVQLGQFDSAANHLRESIRLDSKNAEAHYLLAIALACQGQIDDPLLHCAQATTLQPGIDTSVIFHDQLASNYAKEGRFNEAIRSAERALQLARSSGKNEWVKKVTEHLSRLQTSRASQSSQNAP